MNYQQNIELPEELKINLINEINLKDVRGYVLKFSDHICLGIEFFFHNQFQKVANFKKFHYFLLTDDDLKVDVWECIRDNKLPEKCKKITQSTQPNNSKKEKESWDYSVTHYLLKNHMLTVLVYSPSNNQLYVVGNNCRGINLEKIGYKDVEYFEGLEGPDDGEIQFHHNNNLKYYKHTNNNLKKLLQYKENVKKNKK